MTGRYMISGQEAALYPKSNLDTLDFFWHILDKVLIRF
jgi:hypothetical protein